MSAKRNILAALLIFCIFMLIPQYLKMVGVESETPNGEIVNDEDMSVAGAGKIEEPDDTEHMTSLDDEDMDFGNIIHL